VGDISPRAGHRTDGGAVVPTPAPPERYQSTVAAKAIGSGVLRSPNTSRKRVSSTIQSSENSYAGQLSTARVYLAG
jgi:hypothetical protein